MNVKVVLEDTAFYRIKSVGTYCFISSEKRRMALCRPLTTSGPMNLIPLFWELSLLSLEPYCRVIGKDMLQALLLASCWLRHYTLTMLLSTQVYEWLTATGWGNLILKGFSDNLQWAWIPYWRSNDIPGHIMPRKLGKRVVRKTAIGSGTDVTLQK